MKKYNFISVGREKKNSFTGNHSISDNQLIGSNKPFKFFFEDGTSILVPHSVISSYVSTHPEIWRHGCWVGDEDNKKWIPANYVLIPDEFILTYAA